MATFGLTPYLLFDGECREAMKLYHSVFGGTLEIQTYGELDASTEPKMRDLVMHSHLRGGRAALMAGDSPQSSGDGGKVQLTLSGTDDLALRQAFEALAAGGEVVTPLDRQMWGDVYGALTDRFGIGWMVNISSE